MSFHHFSYQIQTSLVRVPHFLISCLCLVFPCASFFHFLCSNPVRPLFYILLLPFLLLSPSWHYFGFLSSNLSFSVHTSVSICYSLLPFSFYQEDLHSVFQWGSVVQSRIWLQAGLYIVIVVSTFSLCHSAQSMPLHMFIEITYQLMLTAEAVMSLSNNETSSDSENKMYITWCRLFCNCQ